MLNIELQTTPRSGNMIDYGCPIAWWYVCKSVIYHAQLHRPNILSSYSSQATYIRDSVCHNSWGIENHLSISHGKHRNIMPNKWFLHKVADKMVNIRDLQWQRSPGKILRWIGIHKVMNDDLTMCSKTFPGFPSKTKTNRISFSLIDYIWVILMK